MESDCGGILRLCLYTDEVVQRNKLRPDMGGKYQAVYFQIMDLPDWIRARAPLRWFKFGYVSVAQIHTAGVGVEQLMRAAFVVVRSFLEPYHKGHSLAERRTDSACVRQIHMLATR